MRRFAAIDIGTNSIKITVADCDDSGSLTAVLDRVEITRLGKDVDRTGALAPEAMAKTLAVLENYVDEARAVGAAQICAVGTSALRDAANGQAFRDDAERILGHPVDVISGDREAAFTYLAAVSDSTLMPGSDVGVVTFDVGGGSTELVYGIGQRIISARSVDLGAVRLTERLLRAECPSAAELTEAAHEVDRMLSGSAIMVDQPALIGIGGTAATICAMIHPHAKDVHGLSVDHTDLQDCIVCLAAQPLEERKKTPGLDPLRADVIVAGMVIIERILAKFAAQSYTLSRRGVRYGVLLEMAHDAQRGF